MLYLQDLVPALVLNKSQQLYINLNDMQKKNKNVWPDSESSISESFGGAAWCH